MPRHATRRTEAPGKAPRQPSIESGEELLDRVEARERSLADQEVAAVGHDPQRRSEPPRVLEGVADRDHPVAAWNRQAETCGRHLSKGKRVAVDGRLHSRSWEEADGKRRTSLEVVANAVEFLPMTQSEPGAEAPFEEATMST